MTLSKERRRQRRVRRLSDELERAEDYLTDLQAHAKSWHYHHSCFAPSEIKKDQKSVDRQTLRVAELRAALNELRTL